MYRVPSETKEWTQANQSDLFGNVWITKNCTFDEEGYLRLSYSPRACIDESVDGDFDNPAVIIFSEDYGYFVETWDSAFEIDTNILESTPQQIATSGVPSGDIQSDACFFGGLMPVTQDTDVDYYDPAANSWTDTNISLTSAGQHPCVPFLSLSALAIADVNTVKLYASPLSATPTLLTTLTISSDFRITGMCYFNQNLYIGTHNIYGQHAFMYVWNGLGTAANQVYEVDSNVIFSLCAHQNSIIVLSGNGSLLRFNGGGFDPIPNAQFPIYYNDQSLTTDASNINMYKNVMKSNGNLLYILFNNSENDDNLLLCQPDGLWCYDERIGLYHRYSVSNALVKVETVLQAAVVNSVITVVNDYPTGTEVVFNGSTGITPLVTGDRYFVIRVDSTHIRLAYTYAEAVAGTSITLSAPGVSNTFSFYPNVDFGAFFSSRTFSLNVIERSVSNRKYGVDALWGSEVYRRDNTGNYATINTAADYIGSRGYFVTPKMFSTDVTDQQNLVTLKFSPFISELNKIIIKYRTYDDMLTFIDLDKWDITWTSTTTFTTTETNWLGAVVGNEVEVLTGAAGGLLAHITAISDNAGTRTVTIDETYANYVSGDISRAVFRNFIKWKTIEDGDSYAEQFFISEQLGSEGKFFQLKIELRGIHTRIEELLVDNVFRLPAEDKR